MFFNLGNDHVLEKNMELAGFTSIKIIRIQSSLDYDTDKAACAAAFEGGPVALAYFKFPENVKKKPAKNTWRPLKNIKQKMAILYPVNLSYVWESSRKLLY